MQFRTDLQIVWGFFVGKSGKNREKPDDTRARRRAGEWMRLGIRRGGHDRRVDDFAVSDCRSGSDLVLLRNMVRSGAGAASAHYFYLLTLRSARRLQLKTPPRV